MDETNVWRTEDQLFLTSVKEKNKPTPPLPEKALPILPVIMRSQVGHLGAWVSESLAQAGISSHRILQITSEMKSLMVDPKNHLTYPEEELPKPQHKKYSSARNFVSLDASSQA